MTCWLWPFATQLPFLLLGNQGRLLGLCAAEQCWHDASSIPIDRLVCVQSKPWSLSASEVCLLFLQIQPSLLLNGDSQQFPLIYFEEFWMLRDKLISMNSTVEEVLLQLSVKPMKLWWMQIQQQVRLGAVQQGVDVKLCLLMQWFHTTKQCTHACSKHWHTCGQCLCPDA